MTELAYATSRLGSVKPETRAIAEEVFEAAKAAGHDVWFIWGMGTSAEHKTGLALDFMVRNEAGGDWVRNYIWENRARFRLHHVIWEQHITSTVILPGTRRKMADRGNATANHFDHVHQWNFPGPYRPPVGSTTTPVSTSVIKKGATGEEVRKIQRFFLAVFPSYRHEVSVRRGVPMVVDGVFGDQTEAWVKEFQKRSEIKVDGEVGPATFLHMQRYGYR